MSATETLKFPRYGWLIMLAAAGLYVALSLHLPVGVLGGAGHDDGWFFAKARTLVAGHWFGPFSEMTLIKGPGYTFFLAANYLLGVPVTLSQALLYAFGCALFSHAVFRLTRSTPLSLALFLLTLWHPDMFAVRLIRDDIYGAQSLIYFACLIQLLFAPLAPRARRVWAVAAGLSFAWLWMTREEGVWILPATVILCAVRLWRERAQASALAVFGATAIGAWCLVAACNLFAYHTFTVVDFKSRAYSHAVAALQSVRVGDPVAYVPVPAKVRAQVYAVSPAFASLKPFFEGVPGKPWTAHGCQVYPSTCGDYAGGWFVWALRDAAGQAGHYHTPRAAAAFYDQITAEVKAGCRSGQLHCVPGLVAFMPAITPSQRALIPSKLHDLADMLLAKQAAPSPFESGGTAMQLDGMWEFEGFPRRTGAPTDPPSTLVGWFYAKSGAWIQLSCSQDGRAWIAPIARLASPDIAAHFNDPAATDRRFSAELPADADCSVQQIGAADPGLSFDQLLRSRDQRLDGNELFIDSYGATARDVADQYAHKAEAVLSALYMRLMPLLALAAAAAYLAHLWLLARGRARPDGYWLLCHVLWLSIAARLAILLLVDISSFPGIVMGYVAATLPLECAALLMTLYLPFRQTGLTRWTWRSSKTVALAT